MLTLRTSFSVYSRFLCYTGIISSTNFVQERNSLPRYRQTQTPYQKMHSSSDRNDHDAMTQKRVSHQRLESKSQIVKHFVTWNQIGRYRGYIKYYYIIKLKKYHYKCELSISVPSGTLWYNLWLKSYEYELMKPKIIYCICFVCLCDGK